MGLYFYFSEKDAKRLLYILIFIEIILVGVFLLNNLFFISNKPINRFFGLDREMSIPTWFSSVQLFAIGVLFLFSKNWPQISKVVKPSFLLIVGLGFLYLSADEVATIHENSALLLKHIEWLPRFNNKHYGIWIPIYFSITLILAISGASTIKSFYIAYPKQAKIIFLGFIILIIAGMGLEIVSYYLNYSTMPLLVFVEVVLEEFFEMAGASIILYGTILCALREL